MFPENRIDGLRILTDETGIIQHTKFSLIDRRYGYSTDDNARALIAALRYNKIFGGTQSLNLANTYLTFLLHMHITNGKFHNFLGYNREYQDNEGTEDSIGHALWALGKTMNSNSTDEMKKLAKWLFDNSLPHARIFKSPRAIAFSILGLNEYSKVYPKDENIIYDIITLSDHLIKQYGQESNNYWKWYESYMTYANARIPQSLLKAYDSTGRNNYYKIAKESFDYLIEIEFNNDVFEPIGTQGWLQKNGVKPKYDQQPIEAACMAEVAVDAWKITGEENYSKIAVDSFLWFHGKNTNQKSLINTNNFTCYDGLTPEGINLNQGAESTISYYLSYLKLKECKMLETGTKSHKGY